MIRVFNGDAFAFQEEEYEWRTALHYFLDGHREDYVLIYRGDRPVKTLSYHDVCYNREVPEMTLYLDQDIFAEARKYFFAYGSQEERWKRAVAVCNRQEEVECILYYQHNPVRTDYPVSEFEEYAIDEELDFELLSRADTYIFEEYEEYTAFIYEVLEHRFPEKRKYFLDENAEIFLGVDKVCCALPDKRYRLTDGTVLCGDNIVCINSKRAKDDLYLYMQPLAGVYSSLDIMTSLFWKKKERICGTLNPDKRFLLIRFPLYSSGLCDVIRFCMAKVAMAEYLKSEYIPVIDLSVPGDGNQFSGGRTENVWEDFFEPLNEYSAGEVLQSQNVLVCEDKIDAFNPYIMEQFFNSVNMRKICKKYLRLNREMSAYIERVKRELGVTGSGKSGKKMLGVVARGTDFRYGGFDAPQPMADDEYIELVKCKMDEWDCGYLLLATEDREVLGRFKEAGFGDKLRCIDQERYQYTDVEQPGILVAKLKNPVHDYHDEMPYLAVLYMLAECDSLISNCRCGAFVAADYISGGTYENGYCYGKGED